MYFKIAWRNIWRNKRRTVITTAAIALAVFLAIVAQSASNGSYENMIKNVAGLFTGYIQIHQKGYWEDKTLDNSFTNDLQQQSLIKQKAKVSNIAPRLESFALASSENNTKGTLVIGIDPENEKKVTQIDQKIIDGEYLSNDENALLISEGLAKYLKLNVNDTVVLLGQGYHGISAAGKFPIKGIIKFPSPNFNNGLIYLPLEKAQWLYSMDNLVTSWVVMIDRPAKLDQVKDILTKTLNKEQYEIMSWQEMMPELVQFIDADKAGNYITIGVLYMIIAFGIFGTILMMTNERKHEFGIMIGIGMRNAQLANIVFIETILLAVLGVIVGIVISIPVVAYFVANPIRFQGEMADISEKYGMEPILPFSTDLQIFTSQAWVVLIISAIIAIYPVVKIMRTNALKAIRS